MTFAESLSYLLSLGHEVLAMKLGLANTEQLLGGLGNPHSKYKKVQIAGTNGKGSTAVMLDSICRAAGIRTGLFTSPHLVSITERIKIDGQDILPGEFARQATIVRDVATQLLDKGRLDARPTFFEHMTAIGLLTFAEAEVDVAILETGLGGRLDSTTAARAEIVGLSSISIDHQEYLGNTLLEIAAEKAAIIHDGVSLAIAPQTEEVTEVIREQYSLYESISISSPCQATIDDVTDDGRAITTFATAYDRYERVCLSLRGRHQAFNGYLAIQLAEALRELGIKVTRDAIIHGLEHAVHPGRLEFFELGIEDRGTAVGGWGLGVGESTIATDHPSPFPHPPSLIRQHPSPGALLLDGAHNPAGACALAAFIIEFIKVPLTIVFGAMRGKAITEICETLFPLADRIVLTVPANERAASADEIEAELPEGLCGDRIMRANSSREALEVARNVTPEGGMICVTGSLYLVGEVRAIIQ